MAGGGSSPLTAGGLGTRVGGQGKEERRGESGPSVASLRMVRNALELKGCLLLSAPQVFSSPQRSSHNVTTIKRKPLEISKGKLDNMCFDAGIWSLKVKETGKTSEVCICSAPIRHINILLMCLCKFFTEVSLLSFSQVSSDISNIL